MALRLTDRDMRMLAKCAVCRWLTTGQIQRLYFSHATLNAVQKRLRKLSDEAYLRVYRENPMAEALHAVGPKAKPILEARGVVMSLPDETPRQIEHLTGVNAIRIALETSGLPLAFFFAYWQLASIGWTFPVIPDAICAFRAEEGQRRRFLIEYDRGTEPLRVLVQKLRSYSAGVSGFAPEAVLFVTEENRRLDQLRRALEGERMRITCLVTQLSEVERTPGDPVLLDLKHGTYRSLLFRA